MTDSNETPFVRLPVRDMRDEPAPQRAAGVIQQAIEALEDITSGWKYIRSMHGDLYGVGWDRAQGKAESALASLRAAQEGDLPPLTEPDLMDIGSRPQDIKEFLAGYATSYARLALAAAGGGVPHGQIPSLKDLCEQVAKHLGSGWLVIGPDGSTFQDETPHRAANAASKHRTRMLYEPEKAAELQAVIDGIQRSREEDDARLLETYGALNCPMCGGSGHVGDALLASSPQPEDAPAVAQVPQCHKRANDYCKCSRKAMLCDGMGPLAAAPEAPAVAQVQQEETPAELALREIACFLGVGGYNAPTVDADMYRKKIMEELINSATTDAENDKGPLLDGEGWTVTLANGHAGPGWYAHCEDYPEEGAVFIAAAPEAPAQADKFTQADLNAEYARGRADGWEACVNIMLAAAPEAPAQDNCEHLRPMDKVCAPCGRYPNREAPALAAQSAGEVERNAQKLLARFDELLNRYWSLGYAEGKEGRDHDTEGGDAQITLCELHDLFRAALSHKEPQR